EKGLCSRRSDDCVHIGASIILNEPSSTARKEQISLFSICQTVAKSEEREKRCIITRLKEENKDVPSTNLLSRRHPVQPNHA
ncbi:unnamed protein product, partial [Hymenolepis diminuta]